MANLGKGSLSTAGGGSKASRGSYGGAERASGIGRGINATFSSRVFAEIGRSSSPTVTRNGARTGIGSPVRAEIGRTLASSGITGLDLQPRYGSGPFVDKKVFAQPERSRGLPANLGAYASVEAFTATSRIDAVPTLAQRSHPSTRLLSISEPGRQSSENGGSSRAMSSDQLRALLGQRNYSGRTELFSGTANNNITIVPEITHRRPIASPFRVEPGYTRLADPIVNKKANPERIDLDVNSQRTRTPLEQSGNVDVSKANIVWISGYSRRVRPNFSESSSISPVTRENGRVLRDTSSSAELAQVPVDSKPARVKSIPDSHILPLPAPDLSGSASSALLTKKQMLVSRGDVHTGGAYVAKLEELERKRDRKEKTGKKSLRVQLLERVNVLRQKMYGPVEQPIIAPVRELQATTSHQAQAALEQKADVTVLPTGRNAQGIGADSVTELKTKSNSKKDQPAEEKRNTIFGDLLKRIKIIYSVDTKVQSARMTTVIHAADKFANEQGDVEGKYISASLANEQRVNLVSSLLRALGFLGKESQIDGSLVKLSIVLAKIKLSKKKDIIAIAKAQIDTDPAVQASEQSNSRRVGKREVSTVVNSSKIVDEVAA